MKAEDLMLGDWVTHANALKAGEFYPIKITSLTLPDRIAGYHPHPAIEGSDVYGEDDLAGIPLTPEILEKNGFKFDGSGQRSMMLISTPLFSEGIRYNIYVGLKKKTIEVFVAHPIEKSPNWRKSNKVYLEVCGCYVHELQRALRLCGIEKEIKL